jgi:hypothetical protein
LITTAVPSVAAELVRIVARMIGALWTFATVGAALGVTARDVRLHFPSWDGLVLVTIGAAQSQRVGPARADGRESS